MLRKLTACLMAGLLLGSVATGTVACVTSTPDQPETETTAPTAAIETPTEVPTEASDTEAPTEAPTEAETEAPEPERTVTNMYDNGYNMNMLVGFDEYGRSLTPVSSRKEDKEVGIFYFLWLGQHGVPEIYDISKILTEYGKDTLFHTDDRKISPAGQFHWWSLRFGLRLQL